MQLAATLRDAGFFIPGIRPPTVPEGESLLRLSLCYHHTPAMIDELAERFRLAVRTRKVSLTDLTVLSLLDRRRQLRLPTAPDSATYR